MGDLHILNYRLVDSATEKPHYVYTVDVQVGGRHRCVEKRYSQFHCLHRQLRKEFQTPTFPPKRVRCSQPRLLEQRRRGLELYLRTMLQLSAPSRSQVLNFLGLAQYHSDREQYEAEVEAAVDEEVATDHQPVFIFKHDPYVQPNSRSKLPDVVVNGILMALYNSADAPPS